ncbi:hypothetical protein [Methylotenera sp.]|uniref:hypothetical protein n=1 Tax=Methylotenera sp. TaxID=2051956 RepID=UPI002486EA12|nr:hypothetical protein [Methylotenera sp.]MDI1297948.1 hypothetical protein [Methylotenera sp.]
MSMIQKLTSMLGFTSAAQPTRALFLMIAVLLTGACMRNDAAIPKEGDVVTWKHNSALIIRAELGQRREHIPNKIDNLIYEPEYERYIGQFPIDYVPEPFPKFTEEERVAFEAEDAKKLHAIKSMHPIEFSLMLNGAKGKTTDAYNNDDENQVKVTVQGLTMDMRTEHITTKSSNERMLASRDHRYFIPESLFHKYGLTCYYNSPEGRRYLCFGNSGGEGVTGVNLLVPTEKAGFTESSYERLISADYYEPIMGGVWIKWQTHPKNWDKWREIDAAVWRLLNAWNVAPHTNTARVGRNN